jgi:hypothetical protein
MLSILGRLITLGGGALIVYSLSLTAIVMSFPVQIEVGGITLVHDMQMEASLFNLGEKLADMDESMQTLPRILNYLWLLFLALAVLNFLTALKPTCPRVLRGLFGLLPLALLVLVVYNTATNSQLGLGFSGLFEFLVRGFYLLLLGCLAVFIGTLFTGQRPVKD